MKKIDRVKVSSFEYFPKDDKFEYCDNPVLNFTNKESTPNIRISKNLLRSDEILKDSSLDVILSAGCSTTFGVGLSEEETWPRILEKLIDKNNTIMYNISRPGWSAYQIVYNVFLYLRNFKKPLEIYVLLPDETRTLGYSFVHKSNANFLITNGTKEDEETNEEIRLANSVHVKNYLFMLEEYCRVQGIKLFISTWCEKNFINNNHEFLNTYYPYNKKSALKFIKKYEEENPDSEFIFLARDDHHQGVGYHSYWADMFYKIRQESL